MHTETRLQMQEALRTTAAPHMDASDLKIFLDSHRDGTLVQPSDVGYVIANLSLRAPSSLSGSFVRYNDERCKEFSRK